MKIVLGILSVCVTIPIWFYLLYQILVRVQATELMFFLFWVYVPVMFGCQIMAQIIVKDK